MNIQLFEGVSIRGRFAYALCCLEKLLEKCSQDMGRWSLLLDRLWKYPATKAPKELLLWDEINGECSPWVITEKIPFEDKNFRHLDREAYNKFCDLYSLAHPSILEVINFMFDISSFELFGTIKSNSPECWAILGNPGNSADRKNPPSNPDLFKRFSFNQDEGWGNPIGKNDVPCLTGLS